MQEFLSKTVFASFVSNYFSSILVMVTNFVIAPLIIAYFTSKEHFDYKSDLNKSIIIRLFIFFTFAYILLPLTGYVAISEFFMQTTD